MVLVAPSIAMAPLDLPDGATIEVSGPASQYNAA
jgi:hypothetical protein